MKENFNIWEFKPYGLDGNLGAAYNKYCRLVTNKHDWIVLWDCDTMVLTRGHEHIIHEAINRHDNVGLFTCYTNRVGTKDQVADMSMFDNPSISDHMKLADKLKKEKGSDVKYINHVISGHMMCFSKEVWEDVSGFRNGILGVDNKFSHAVLMSKRKIAVIEGVYCMHYYRFNEGIDNKNHLKIN